MRSLLFASLLVSLAVLVGCAKAEEPAATTGTAPVTQQGTKGGDLGSSDATPVMSKEEADKKAGSALGK